MVSVRFNANDLRVLADPARIARAELEMVDSAIDVLVPLARDESPARTGRGKSQIVGQRIPGRRVAGRVHAGKAFWLRILATGTYKKPGGFDIAPFKFKSKSKARRALRSLGPARARGATRALRFALGGSGVLFRARVRHPGLKADPWMERAARRGESPVGQAAELVVGRALNEGLHG